MIFRNMKKLIVANWKANPDSVRRAVSLAFAIESSAKYSKNKIVIAPPFPFLAAVKKVLRRVKLGAQNVSENYHGPYTGEVTAEELKDLGVSYVIVGHSERRSLGETDLIINKKIKAAIKKNLKVILCVGEPWSVRKKGIRAAEKFVREQLQKDLKGIENWKLKIENLIVAYEPVWAIGTGRADKTQDAVEMARFIKNILYTKYKILYGGSVTAKNATKFLSQKEIDGALVGGASLKPKEFKKIIQTSGNAIA